MAMRAMINESLFIFIFLILLFGISFSIAKLIYYLCAEFANKAKDFSYSANDMMK
jgi:hypothetical protein